jgi:hypothetical protein
MYVFIRDLHDLKVNGVYMLLSPLKVWHQLSDAAGATGQLESRNAR